MVAWWQHDASRDHSSTASPTASPTTSPTYCEDDDAAVQVTGGGLTCAVGFDYLGGQCDDDSIFVAAGAPAGWFASMCPATCGYCDEDEVDDAPPCIMDSGCYEPVDELTCEWLTALVECGGPTMCADDVAALHFLDEMKMENCYDCDCPDGWSCDESQMRRLEKKHLRKAGRKLFGVEVPHYCVVTAN